MDKSKNNDRRSGITAAFLFSTFGVFFLLLFLCGSITIPAQIIEKNKSEQQQITVSAFHVSRDVTKTLISTGIENKSIPASNTPVATLVPTIKPLELPQMEPAGCRKPDEDYSRIWVRGNVLNNRTYHMLEHAASMYHGEIDILGMAITQGSFSDNGSASFGTHLGGGAVDLSVRSIKDYSVLYNEIDPLIRALRVAGFAAWLRENDEVYPGTGIHIHAIAIGDQQLSYPAQQQLTGIFGYFRGYNGIPNEDGILFPDRHGGPVLCQWMRDMGYEDLRTEEDDHSTLNYVLPDNWRDNLIQIAEQYRTYSMQESIDLALELDYAFGNQETPFNMRAALAGTILNKAGFINGNYQAAKNIRNFNPDRLSNDVIPWGLFSKYEFSQYQFSEALSQFDFSTFQLLSGDVIVAYDNHDLVKNLFVVTEVDEFGRVYTVTNVQQAPQDIRVQRLLIYNQAKPSNSDLKDGMLLTESMENVGNRGFDVMRRKGVTLPAGTEYSYFVKPGDTLLSIAEAYNCPVSAIIHANPGINIQQLSVDDNLKILVDIDKDDFGLR